MFRKSSVVIVIALIVVVYGSSVLVAQNSIPTESYLPVVIQPENTATPTATTIPSPTAAPQTVFVKSSRRIRSGDALRIVGEIINGTNRLVYSTKLEVRFYDAQNQLVAVDDGFTYLGMTGPGASNPFDLYLSDAPPSIVRHELTVSHATSSFFDYRQITVLSQAARRTSSGVEVFGEIRNDAEKAVRSPEVVVTFYDATGAVVDVEIDYTSGDLPKGQVRVYSAQTFRNVPYTSYFVQAQSYLVP